MEGWDEQWMEKLLSKPAGLHLINVLYFKFTESAFTDVPPPIPRTDVNQSECSPQTDVTSLFKVHELIQEITQDNQVESVICTKMFKSITPLSREQDFFYFFFLYHFICICIVSYIYKIYSADRHHVHRQCGAHTVRTQFILRCLQHTFVNTR